MQRALILGAAISLAGAGTVLGVGGAAAAPVHAASTRPGVGPNGPTGPGYASPPFRVKVIGRLPDGKPKLSASSPTGLPPSALKTVYGLSDLKPPITSTGSGAGQTIAIVDAYHDPHALTDLNKWNKQYGYPALSSCTSPLTSTSTGPCFAQVDPEGKPKSTSGWALEESLDIEWAHAEAPNARIVLVEALTNSDTHLFTAVRDAVSTYHATEVSMSWGGSQSSSETTYDSSMAATGVFYTASAGDSGHGAEYPAASPNVLAVGGTTLTGCSGTSCTGFTGQSAWSTSGGGISAYEAIPVSQSDYTGPVYGATTITALTGAKRGIPDVAFDASPSTGVSIYDSTRYHGQSGWFTVGGTSVGAPNWAGILAAGASTTGATALQGSSEIYGGGYSTNLTDITSGTNGTCGTDCAAGAGYDLVTGLGTPLNYP